MSDRLNDLQRQRALAQEQVAWFDREIARERGAATPAPKSPAPNPAVDDGFHEHLAGMAAASAATGPAAKISPVIDQQAEEIIERFKQTERPLRDHVRRGCFVYFFIAFALVGIALLALYAWHQAQAR